MHGPSRDLHSGIYGGTVDNPALALSQVLARLRDKNGRVAIPGFYDDVAAAFRLRAKTDGPLSHDRGGLSKVRWACRVCLARRVTSFIEQRSARPTLEINGLTSGYQGEGSKTIIPAWARAKLTFRLVPDQKPERVRQVSCQASEKNLPADGASGSEAGHGAEPYLVSPDGELARAAWRR